MKKLILIILALSAIVLSILLLEIITQKLNLNTGILPVSSNDIHCNPQIMTFNNSTGYRFQPGKYNCAIGDLKMTITHNSDSSRATSDKLLSEDLEKIHVYGCSITWGHGLDDTATMCWRLQKLLPQYKIYNYGVGAFSDVQSFVLLKQNINENNIPKVVILNYASFHNERNVLTTLWRTIYSTLMESPGRPVKDFKGIPYIVKDEKNNLLIKQMPYKTLKKTSLTPRNSFVQTKVNSIFNNYRDKKCEAFGNTFLLLKEINQYCKQHNIGFIIGIISKNENTSDMVDQLHKAGITTVDLLDGMNQKDHTLQPYDNHPNGLANRIFAERLFSALSKI